MHFRILGRTITTLDLPQSVRFPQCPEDIAWQREHAPQYPNCYTILYIQFSKIGCLQLGVLRLDASLLSRDPLR
jgi:hypothetical protein